jgi:transaldolase
VVGEFDSRELHNLGQSLGLDNITRDLLDDGTLKRYIDDFSVTGLASNPTIFEHAISKNKSYDPEIIQLAGTGISGEQLFFELASIRCDLSMCLEIFRVWKNGCGFDSKEKARNPN